MTPKNEPPTYQPFPDFMFWEGMEVSLRDVDEATSRLQEVKKNVSQDSLDAALDQARREAAVDTNAIEGVFQTDRGFTRTVALRASAWEQMMENKGTHVRPAFEDTLAGFDYIMDAMTCSKPVTEHWIRELHAVMLRSQDTHPVHTTVGVQEQLLPKGEYKNQPNSPTRPDGTVHAYAPVEETPPEMRRLLAELSSKSFHSAHPVLQAAYVHYAFVCIHPFADGNGRVARALASIYLYRSPGVPLVIYQDQRVHYIKALESADDGDPRLLARFIAERVTDTINLLITELTRPIGRKSSSEELAELLKPTRVMPKLQDAVVRLKEIVHSEIRTRLDHEVESHGLPFHLLESMVGTPSPAPEGYKAFGDDMGLTLSININSPKKVFTLLNILMLARESDAATSDLVALTSAGYRLDVFARELEPVVTESVRTRARIYADGVVDSFLGKFAAAFRA